MSSFLKEIVVRRELLWILTLRNLKIRYKGSALGFFWSLFTPLMFILIYTVFARILRFNEGDPRFFPYLIIGIIVWQFLATCLGDSLHSVMGNANLVKKTAFPRLTLPLSTVTANLINYMLTLLVLLAFLIPSGAVMGNWLWFIPALITQFALCLGLACAISAVNVFLRDTEHMIGVATLAWFFLSPVFYPIKYQTSRLPGNEWLIYLNPMTGILSALRSVFMAEPLPSLSPILLSFGVSWAILLVGVTIFLKLERKFADEL